MEKSLGRRGKGGREWRQQFADGYPMLGRSAEPGARPVRPDVAKEKPKWALCEGAKSRVRSSRKGPDLIAALPRSLALANVA